MLCDQLSDGRVIVCERQSCGATSSGAVGLRVALRQ